MSKENIQIIENPEKGFVEIKCADGHYITNWDKKDILEYTDAKLMYAPIGFDLSTYYCVTDEEHNAYVAELDEKIEEKIKEIDNE